MCHDRTRLVLLALLHHVPAASIDYAALALGAFASWAGIPGPGEPLLIAAGIVAARHKLDITPVLVWAWVGGALVDEALVVTPIKGPRSARFSSSLCKSACSSGRGWRST